MMKLKGNLSEISDAAVLIDIGFGMKWLEDVDDIGID